MQVNFCEKSINQRHYEVIYRILVQSVGILQAGSLSQVTNRSWDKMIQDVLLGSVLRDQQSGRFVLHYSC